LVGISVDARVVWRAYSSYLGLPDVIGACGTDQGNGLFCLASDGQISIGYSDQTIYLGAYDASLEQLEQLKGQSVTIEIVR
jgi:hypothetical protein